MKKHLCLLLELAVACCALLAPAAAAEEISPAPAQADQSVQAATPETAAAATAEQNPIDQSSEETIFKLFFTGDGFPVIGGLKEGHELEEAVIDGVLVLPDQVDGKWVTGISPDGLNAAASNGGTLGTCVTTAKSIHFPKVSTWIGDNGCQAIGTGFEEIVIPDTVWQIGSHAFEGVGTERFVFPENSQYTAIQSGTMAGTAARTVVIPATITRIEEGAFENTVGASAIKTIEYRGTKEQWQQISIGGNNGALTNGCAEIKFSDGTIEPGQHEWSQEKEVVQPPTCTDAGLKGYVCTYCEEVKDPEEIPSLGGEHTYDEGVITKRPTTQAEGSKLYTCTRCGATRAETLPQLTEDQVVIRPELLDPTSDETIFVAGLNGEKRMLIWGTKDGHAVSEAVVDGVLLLPDSIDDIPVTVIAVDGLNATIPEYGTQGTWVTNAKMIHFPKDLELIGPSAFQGIGTGFEEIVVPNTVRGIYPRAFEGIGTERFVFPKNEYYTTIQSGTLATAVARTVAIPATITRIEEGAFNHDPYSFASSSFAMKTIEYGGTMADWGRMTIGGNNGTLTHKCAEIVCTDGRIAPQHEWGQEKEVIQSATCEEDGLQGIACAYCKETKDTEVIPALGHRYDAGTVTKPATQTEEGIRTYTCTVCGAQKTEAIPKVTPAASSVPAGEAAAETAAPTGGSASPAPAASARPASFAGASAEPSASVVPSASASPAESAAPAASQSPAVSSTPTAQPGSPDGSTEPDSSAAVEPASRIPLLLLLLAALLLVIGLVWFLLAAKRRQRR